MGVDEAVSKANAVLCAVITRSANLPATEAAVLLSDANKAVYRLLKPYAVG